MTIENKSLPIGDAESSDEDSEDPSKEDRNKKSNVPPQGRWLRVPLERSSGLFDKSDLNQRKSFFETAMRPPPPPERLISPAETDDEDEDEEKDDEDKSSAKPNDISVESDAAETADAMAAADKQAEQPAARDGTFETFETFEAAAKTQPGTSGLMEIPRIEEEKPTTPLSFEEILAREMPPEFTEAASGPELRDPYRKDADIPPIPSWEMPVTEHPLGPNEAAPLGRPASVPPAGSGASSWRPPSPSAPFEAGPYAPPAPSGFEAAVPAPSSSGGSELFGGFTTALEALKAVTDLSELVNNPNRMVSRILMQAALEGYLTQRKQDRYRDEPLLQRQQEEITRMREQQRQANERIAAHFQNEATQAAQAGAERQIFDQDGNQITLLPGQRVERSPGGYSVVLDQHNHVVHDAIRYGEAFQREQKREQLSDDVFTALGASGPSGGSQDSSGFASPTPAAGQHQAPYQQGQHALPSGEEERVDLNHRLPEPRHTIRDAVLSPWLWLAVALLIIVYFISALV